MASEAFYERVLALVEPQELHRSCNDVLNDEYRSCQKVVDGVAAAFAKVEEVRDAVKQLEQGKPSAGRSESLMKTLDSTMEVHTELKKRLDLVAVGMTVQAEVKVVEEEKTKENNCKRTSEVFLDEKKKQKKRRRKKKKRNAESLSSATSSSIDSSSLSSSSSAGLVEENEEADDKSTHKQAKVKNQKVTLNKEADPSPIETKPVEMTASLQLAQECSETVSLLKGADKIPVEMTERWSQALDGIKRILKEKSGCDRVLWDDAVVRITIRTLHSIAAVVTTLKWTPMLATEVESLITVMTDPWSRNNTLCLHSARKKIKRVFRFNEQLRVYHKLADGVASLPDRERSERIVKSLRLLQEILVNTGSKHIHEVQIALKQVRGWASELPLDENLRHCYGVFANKAGSHIKRKFGAKEVVLRRLVGTIPSLIHKRLGSSGKPRHS